MPHNFLLFGMGTRGSIKPTKIRCTSFSASGDKSFTIKKTRQSLGPGERSVDVRSFLGDIGNKFQLTFDSARKLSKLQR